MAVSQDESGKVEALAFSYAHALGATRAGVLEAAFEEETEPTCSAGRSSSATASPS